MNQTATSSFTSLQYVLWAFLGIFFYLTLAYLFGILESACSYLPVKFPITSTLLILLKVVHLLLLILIPLRYINNGAKRMVVGSEPRKFPKGALITMCIAVPLLKILGNVFSIVAKRYLDYPEGMIPGMSFETEPFFLEQFYDLIYMASPWLQILAMMITVIVLLLRVDKEKEMPELEGK